MVGLIIFISIFFGVAIFVGISVAKQSRESDKRYEEAKKTASENIGELRKMFPKDKIKIKDGYFYFNSHKTYIGYLLSYQNTFLYALWLGVKAQKGKDRRYKKFAKKKEV